jgi:acyl carrier protein phosphodiesterase
MGLTIKKFYDENIQVAPFRFSKIGMEIASDRVLTTPEEVENMSKKLNAMAKSIVRKELAEIKKESVE